MDEHTACERAYKNGYEQGQRDAVKHGRWIPAYGDKWFKCSECNSHWERGIVEHCNVNFCPHCGAKMDREDDNG